MNHKPFVSAAMLSLTTFALATYASDAPAQSFRLVSPVFGEGEEIPVLYTCDGSNISPPITWDDAPRETKTFALVAEDSDLVKERPFVHWVIFNVPRETHGLAESMRRNSLPGGALEGKNSFGRDGYDGPCPPSGKSHRYVFTLYALDTSLDRVVYRGATFSVIEKGMSGHVVGTTTLVASYSRTN